MNITEIIFISAMFFALWMIFGKCFKRLNPFIMFLGLVVFAPTLQILIDFDSWYYSTAFIIGFVANFGNPLSWIMAPLTELRMGFQLSRAKARARARQQSEFQEAEETLREKAEDLYRQKEDIEQELHRQKREAENDIKRQDQEAAEKIRRAAEELKRREEAFRQQQEQFYREQSKGIAPLLVVARALIRV